VNIFTPKFGGKKNIIYISILTSICFRWVGVKHQAVGSFPAESQGHEPYDLDASKRDHQEPGAGKKRPQLRFETTVSTWCFEKKMVWVVAQERTWSFGKLQTENCYTK